MLTAVIISFILLVFPFFLNFHLFLCGEHKKVYFYINLFGFIKIFGGYACFYEKGIAIHLSSVKAVIIPFKSLFSMKKKIKPLNDYHIIKLNYLVEAGNKDNPFLPLGVSFMLNGANTFINAFLEVYKPYLRVEGEYNIYLNEDLTNLYLKGQIVFNLLMVLISVIKILTEKIYYAINKRLKKI